ncbi:Probable RNA-directed DNA polymerase from transposon BS [Eumeta japonica]|uniref:Probable RNA-directed DNA polymerase from transposon BS n=1 Tax=Eumeta variegata TaxID=151549 RepID=A0A4C1UNN8_EUMVA|nr:Probable RNA-directed DNA polymerase from transposon BS [Eumeta japonica]
MLGKLYERLLYQRLKDFIESERILINEQFGYRLGHSCTLQVHRVTEYIYTMFSRRHPKLTAQHSSSGISVATDPGCERRVRLAARLFTSGRRRRPCDKAPELVSRFLQRRPVARRRVTKLRHRGPVREMAIYPRAPGEVSSQASPLAADVVAGRPIERRPRRAGEGRYRRPRDRCSVFTVAGLVGGDSFFLLLTHRAVRRLHSIEYFILVLRPINTIDPIHYVYGLGLRCNDSSMSAIRARRVALKRPIARYVKPQISFGVCETIKEPWPRNISTTARRGAPVAVA